MATHVRDCQGTTHTGTLDQLQKQLHWTGFINIESQYNMSQSIYHVSTQVPGYNYRIQFELTDVALHQTSTLSPELVNDLLVHLLTKWLLYDV